MKVSCSMVRCTGLRGRMEIEGKYMHRYDIESEVHLEEYNHYCLPSLQSGSTDYGITLEDQETTSIYIIEECLSWDISTGCTYNIYDIQSDFSFSLNSRIASPEHPTSLAPSRFGWFRPLCFQTEGDKEVLFYGLLPSPIYQKHHPVTKGNIDPVNWGWGVIPYTNTLVLSSDRDDCYILYTCIASNARFESLQCSNFS
ncbi:hypothetical protein FRX31_018704 [Thalictrum thalictroides]|uniref:Uncharacterized protein n=1 Tax=Thalictrum thalictroides TaxID=46969 RepID=A0A7J6W2V6_THATH|nr:hypothetical protein FRX31_018704 [Thalictrum thalictroides]